MEKIRKVFSWMKKMSSNALQKAGIFLGKAYILEGLRMPEGEVEDIQKRI